MRILADTAKVVEYFAYQLLTNSATPEVQAFLNKYDFILFPVVNPDGKSNGPSQILAVRTDMSPSGFLYSQTNDRLWRKNRQSTPGSTCIGHDINRNWPYQWSVSGGASTNPCGEDFRGAKQGDAPETAALSAWLQATKEKQGLKLFIDWHSYSQPFMTREFDPTTTVLRRSRN